MPKRLPARMRNVSRLDGPRAVGWWVRISHRDAPVSKLFSDSRHGGREKALQSALAFRDEALKSVPPPVQSPPPPGPGRTWRHLGKTWAWIRVAPGKAASTSYSERRHGVRGAKRKADAWLESKRAEQARGFAATAPRRSRAADGRATSGA